MTWWQLVLLGWGVMAVVMAALWLVQYVRHNAGIVDVAWSFGTGLLGVLFAWGAGGAIERRWLVGAIAGIWGFRLGIYLMRRVLGEAEDGRYRALREQWGPRTQPYLFAFFQIQAFWAMLFALPMLVAASRQSPALDAWDWAGAAVAVLALGGEAIADAQLARFRRDPANRGTVCKTGLWRYSRHPNYFFEWVHWWAYVLIGIAAPWGWLALFGPVLMLLFLFKITGIPPTEARALESRGDAYRQYQRTTSVFVPWPPAKDTANAKPEVNP